MKFALPHRGEGPRAAGGGGPSCPPCPRFCPSACTLRCCPRGVSSLAAPTQPRCWTLGSGLQLPHKPWTCCLQDQGMCPGVSFGRTSSPHHGQLSSASHTTQEQALPSGRQDTESLDVPHSAPHHHTAPGPAQGACSPQHLQSPPGPANPPMQDASSWAFKF